MASMHINVVLCASVPAAQIGRFPVKLAPKVFDFALEIPNSPENA
jgi:hypothetical protein